MTKNARVRAILVDKKKNTLRDEIRMLAVWVGLMHYQVKSILAFAGIRVKVKRSQCQRWFRKGHKDQTGSQRTSRFDLRLKVRYCAWLINDVS